MAKTSVVFFGAGPVASESLRQLLDHFDVEAVITKPKLDKHDAPVIDLATDMDLPVLTPNSRLELTEIFKNKQFVSQVGIVIDFGIIISADVFNSFEYGIVNSHFSLLPEWRGADPITFSLLSGQAETGVSLMRIVEELDEGPIIAQESVKMMPTWDINELTSELIKLSTNMLTDKLPSYLKDKIILHEQTELSKSNNLKTTYSRKIKKSEGKIDWNKTAPEIERQIRAFKGWPQSRCSIGDLELIITEAHIDDQPLSPGQHLIRNKELVLGCGENSSLAITKLKPIGKKEMTTAEFLAGYRSRLI